MPRPEKVAVVDEVRDKLSSSTATVLTEYRGLTVSQLASLRAELRKANAEYKVAKNTLTRIAAREAGLEVPDAMLSGPTALAFCGDDPVSVAKALRTFAKVNPALIVKGALLEGRLLTAEETGQLADLASREEMLSKVAGMIQTLIAQPARLALASLTKMAQLMAALQEKKSSEPQLAAEAPSEEAAAPATDEAEPSAPEAASEAPSEEPAAESPAEDEPTAAETSTEETVEEAAPEEAAPEE